MGQYSGFVARVPAENIENIRQKLESKGVTKINVYPELSLIVGIIKSDRDGGAFVTLVECEIDDFRIMGQQGCEADDYPLHADILDRD